MWNEEQKKRGWKLGGVNWDARVSGGARHDTRDLNRRGCADPNIETRRRTSVSAYNTMEFDRRSIRFDGTEFSDATPLAIVVLSIQV